MPDVTTAGLGQRKRLTMLFGVGATELTAATTAGSTTALTVADPYGDILIAYGDSSVIFIIPSNPKRTEIRTLASSSAVSTTAKTLTMASAAQYAHAIGTEVWKATTPGAATLYYASPSQHASGLVTTKTLAAVELTTLSAGILYYDLDLTEEGRWRWWFRGTSTVVAADDAENEIEVSATSLA